MSKKHNFFIRKKKIRKKKTMGKRTRLQEGRTAMGVKKLKREFEK